VLDGCEVSGHVVFGAVMSVCQLGMLLNVLFSDAELCLSSEALLNAEWTVLNESNLF
jgi:hypothetical protein